MSHDAIQVGLFLTKVQDSLQQEILPDERIVDLVVLVGCKMPRQLLGRITNFQTPNGVWWIRNIWGIVVLEDTPSCFVQDEDDGPSQAGPNLIFGHGCDPGFVSYLPGKVGAT